LENKLSMIFCFINMISIIFLISGQMAVTPEGLSPYAKDIYDRVNRFIKDEILPREPDLAKFNKTNSWKESPLKGILKVT